MLEQWLKLGGACRVAKRTQNRLYRLAAIGQIHTREGADGCLEFRRRDLERLAQERAKAEPTPA